jgi:hypothetical protein
MHAIIKYQRKSVEGISVWLFLFAVCGNLSYCTSIFLKSIDPAYVLDQLAFLLGSGGTLAFDMAIFLQWYFYKRNSETRLLDEM